MKDYRARLMQRFRQRQEELHALVGTQPEHECDLGILSNEEIIESGKALSARLEVLRASDEERHLACLYDRMNSIRAAHDAEQMRQLNEDYPPPPGTTWVDRWQLARHKDNRHTSIYLDKRHAESYAREHWLECKWVRGKRTPVAGELFEEEQR